MQTVSIKGARVSVTSPEGQTATLSVEELFNRLDGREMGTGGIVLPDGVKAIVPQGRLTVWIHQTPPKVHNFKWITNDSPSPFGRGTTYREARIALPYLIVLAVFGKTRDGRWGMTNANECFFRTAPLRSLDDPLFYPALLNCSKFDPPEGKPLSWICTQYLPVARLMRQPDDDQSMRRAFQALMHCLLETGFNYSSEEHEDSSWFTESSRVDPRIATVEAWEAASAESPMFVLEVPWLEVGLSVRQMIDRIAANNRATKASVRSAGDIARIAFNYGKVRKPSDGEK
jgi:hypothetical protein